MKKILLSLASLMMTVASVAQTKEYVVIEKNDKSTVKIEVGDVKQMYFTSEEDKYFTVSATSLSLNSEKGASGNFKITCNVDWVITGVPSWLELSKTSGHGDATITVKAKSDNNDSQARSAKLTITNLVTTTTEIMVTQKKAEGSNFSVTGAPVKLDSKAGAEGSFTINTNMEFTIKDVPSWLEVSPTSGKTTTTVKVKALSANPYTTEREATFYISNMLIGSYSVKVTQAASSTATIFAKPYTKWGASKSQVKNNMTSYKLYKEETNSIVYEGLYQESTINYAFDNDKLYIAVVALRDNVTTFTDLVDYVKQWYSYQGMTDEGVAVLVSKTGDSDKTLVNVEHDTKQGAFFVYFADYDRYMKDDSKLFEEPYTNWGALRASVKTVMGNRGYTLMDEQTTSSGTNIVMYVGKYQETVSAYYFDSSDRLNQVRFIFLESKVSLSDLRTYLSSTLSYTYSGSNTSQGQYFYLAPDKKSYAVVWSSTSGGSNITVMAYVSYDSVSVRQKTRGGEAEMELNSPIDITPDVNVLNMETGNWLRRIKGKFAILK